VKSRPRLWGIKTLVAALELSDTIRECESSIFQMAQDGSLLIGWSADSIASGYLYLLSVVFMDSLVHRSTWLGLADGD